MSRQSAWAGHIAWAHTAYGRVSQPDAWAGRVGTSARAGRTHGIWACEPAKRTSPPPKTMAVIKMPGFC